jgi:hypothetical protein
MFRWAAELNITSSPQWVSTEGHGHFSENVEGWIWFAELDDEMKEVILHQCTHEITRLVLADTVCRFIDAQPVVALDKQLESG